MRSCSERAKLLELGRQSCHPYNTFNAGEAPVTRPTIADLAEAAGVSVSTVNRMLSGKSRVRDATALRMRQSAEEIGFAGLDRTGNPAPGDLPRHRLGFLLQQSTREFYQLLGREIAAACRRRRDRIIDPFIEFADQLAPENVAGRLLALGRDCDAVAVIAADHPMIGEAIRELRGLGKPVVTYITDQSAPERAAFVGTDNWKLGRTAAWLISGMARGEGRVAVFIGHHRYHCQDTADAAFRSYMREHAPALVLDDSRPTLEDPGQACDMATALLKNAGELAGILVLGGGISGVLRAFRDVPADARRHIRLVCRDMGPDTRTGLTEGLVTAALCHPLEASSDALADAMVNAVGRASSIAPAMRIVPFEIVTPENV